MAWDAMLEQAASLEAAVERAHNICGLDYAWKRLPRLVPELVIPYVTSEDTPLMYSVPVVKCPVLDKALGWAVRHAGGWRRKLIERIRTRLVKRSSVPLDAVPYHRERVVFAPWRCAETGMTVHVGISYRTHTVFFVR